MASAPPPDDFRCPISLEFMRDPVILATGQTYDRTSIQRWLDSGHRTCPNTKQVLPDIKLIPNYALRSLIQHWASTNGIDLKKSAEIVPSTHDAAAPVQETRTLISLKAAVESLIKNLSNASVQTQSDAIKEISLLAKQSKANRVCVVEAGGIAAILPLLLSGDHEVEEAGLQSLLELSLDDENKVGLVAEGAVDVIVKSLGRGRIETKIKAAATLNSLALVDVNKGTIGRHPGAIPGLAKLLAEGSLRAKKEAMKTLFALCMFRDNKPKVVAAGVISLLFATLAECRIDCVERALAVLDSLSASAEGRMAIMREPALSTLMRFLRSGTARSKEHAAAVLCSLCADNKKFTLQALDAGALVACLVLLQSGTDRAKRKASLLVRAFREC